METKMMDPDGQVANISQLEDMKISQNVMEKQIYILRPSSESAQSGQCSVKFAEASCTPTRWRYSPNKSRYWTLEKLKKREIPAVVQAMGQNLRIMGQKQVGLTPEHVSIRTIKRYLLERCRFGCGCGKTWLSLFLMEPENAVDLLVNMVNIETKLWYHLSCFLTCEERFRAIARYEKNTQ
jgi:hypothetical protein